MFSRVFLRKKNMRERQGWTKKVVGVKLFLPKKEVGFIRQVSVRRKTRRNMLLVMVLGCILCMCGLEAYAAHIVAEEKEVVIEGGQFSETEETDKAEYDTGKSDKDVPQISTTDSDTKEPSNGTGKQLTESAVHGQSQPSQVTEPVAKTTAQTATKSATKSATKAPVPEDEKVTGNTSAETQKETNEDGGETEECDRITQEELKPERDMGGIKKPVLSDNQVISENTGIYQNQVTIQKQIEENSLQTNQINSVKQSKKQAKEQDEQPIKQGTMKQETAVGESKALLLGFFGIYGIIFILAFLFLYGKGGKNYMKKLLKKLTGFALFLVCLSLVGAKQVQAANIPLVFEQVSEEDTQTSQESEEDAQMSQASVGNGQDLFIFDWKNASDQELDHILGITDFEKTGYWLKSLSKSELAQVLQKDTVLPKEMWVSDYDIEPDGTMNETNTRESVIYYEYCMSLATGTIKAQTFQHSSGYYDYKFTMGSALSHYRMKISGLDTKTDTSTRQTATLAVVAIQQTNGNFVNFSSRAGNYNNSNGYTTKKLSNGLDGTGNYYILDAGFTFTKPAGYTVTLNKENTHVGVCDVYYYDDGNYPTNRRKFTSDVNAGSNVFCSLLARTNLYSNTTVGGSANGAPETPVCYHFTFTPITYTVQYNGNGATSGSVASQICTYGTTYYAQQNGFTRQYNVTYNGNGGLPAKANDVAKYTFKGWGLENANAVTHANGQSYINVKNTQNAVGKFYAIWAPASVTLPSATRSGYAFQGWSALNTASSGSAANTTYTPGANIILYACWKPNSYQIAFQDGVTDEVKAKQAMVYDQKSALKTLESLGISRPGYTFKGWKSSAGSYMDGETVMNLTTGNDTVITMTAEWEANHDTPYKVLHKVQDPNNKEEYSLRQMDTFIGTTGTAVTPDTKEFEGYIAPKKQTVTIAGDGSTQVVYYYDAVQVVTLAYRVEHYLQDKNDKKKYNLDEQNSKNYLANEGDVVTPDVITTYEGYDIPSPQTITITKGSKIVIKYYYQLSNKGSTTNVTNITNNHADILNEGDTINEGDINNFKPGEIKYYKDQAGNQYEILVNQDGTLTIRSVTASATNSENLKLAGTLTINNTKYQVTEIAPYAFKSNKKIKTITIGNGITTIGKSAFEGCTKLVSVKLGVGLSVIGDRAFYGCTSLQTVKTTRTLTKIGSKAFYNCKKLKSYSIGKYVKSIGSYAFYNCKKIKKITLAESMEIVGKRAFYKCNSLKKVSIKSTKLIKVGNGAFKQCSKNIKFTVPAKKKKAYAKLLKGKS